ncbi:bifunctional hydroxymethylpyrimidine kinase/phosphomethylpyrimidine kinase, partial [Staphylococcus pseudintermedius]|uniref:bifunctional hydroxymethylpyrimidine kinase/phosphomethylpyrimidine kinase n=1 Tax=Staphylococcus pseudintermedius TaxID=283734 RepID=UPI002163491E
CAVMQADLKNLQELETYSMVALAAIVTMDKETWSHAVSPVPFDVFNKQLETVISVGPDAVKTGMIGSEEIIQRAGEAYTESGAKNFVVDPIMVCKGEKEV